MSPSTNSALGLIQLGGPWRWTRTDYYGIADPAMWQVVLSCAVVTAVVVVSIARRRAAAWGWLLLALYVPLLPWISNLVGALPWLALSTMCALFPALFGLAAVVVRGLPGWPSWFARPAR